MRFLLNILSCATKICNNYNNIQQLLLISARNFSIHTNCNEQNPTKCETPQLQESTNNEQRSLHVAVIGVPNVGKSTFINNIVNHRVCPISSKVHTTRKANKAIHTQGNTQLVFYDTPGLVTQREIRKHNLEQSFKSGYRHAIQHANVIAVLHDASNGWTRNELHPTVIDTLKAYPSMPSFLVINKIDALKSKRILLDMIKTLTNNMLSDRRHNRRKSSENRKFHELSVKSDERAGSELIKREVSWPNFSDVFLVSAITGSGLNDVHEYLIESAKLKSWAYAGNIYTDEQPEAIIIESVRARLLDYLPQEIPYNLKCSLEYYSTEKNIIYCSVQVFCPSARIERLICGESNGKLRQITERVTSDLVETFGKAISLTIATSSKKQ